MRGRRWRTWFGLATSMAMLSGWAVAQVPEPVRTMSSASDKQAYLFVYFTGDTVEGEKIRFAVSEGNDALRWQELNGGRPVLESTAGTRGLRDPFILRSAEGDRFFLLATDLSAGRTGWGGATDRGSSHLEIWESTDLIHWGQQRHVAVNTPEAGMTWAPEATYDPTIRAYRVYWTSTRFTDATRKTGDGNGPQILMATTRDFRTFTPPVPWFKAADLPGLVRDKGMIDTTVLKDGDHYYRFTKVTEAEGCPSPDILGQRSTSLVPGAKWEVIDRCIGRRAGTPEVEGPSVFAANPGDRSGYRYFLWVDHYGGIGYIPLATNSLTPPIRWTYPRNFRLPKSPRHGSVLAITARERDALVRRFGVTPVPATPPAATDAAGRMADGWVVPPVLASGAKLPAPAGQTVRWTAGGAGLRGDRVENGGRDPLTLKLTGTIALAGGGTVTKRFAVRVLGNDAARLVAYARTPTDAHDANQPLIARSVHLAIGQGGEQPKPLNGDYGVVFASGVAVATDRISLRGIDAPSLFHFADGGIGIIASRVAIDGRTGDPATLIYRSEPTTPAEFRELGTIDLGATGAVVQPRAVWDGTAGRYVVRWRDGAGVAQWTTVTDLARTEPVGTPFAIGQRGTRSRVVAQGNVGPLRTGAVAVDDAALAIDGAVAKALADRFGRVVNVGATVDPLTITASETAVLRGRRVRLRYSDGSVATRAVDWNPADLAKLNRPGTHVVRGTVRQPAYPAIFAYNRADPTIFRYEAGGRVRYLFIATDDTDNDNVGSPHLPIRVADSIAALADDAGGRAREVDLLNRRTRRERTVEGRTIAGCYWAPELHVIGGRLSILFAPCFNPKDDRSNEGGLWSTVAAHIMQLRTGGDPANPADWSQPAAVLKGDGSPLGRAGFDRNISLDMSFFTVGGQSYYTWSQRYLTEQGPLGDPLTWIAKVDPANPTRLTSEPRPIIVPELSFEENLSEGAFAQIHDGRVHLTYSGSGVSPTYVVGGVSADVRADLTEIDNWRKLGAPLQKSVPMPAGVVDYRTYEQGPGHGAFTTDEDGNALYVYHTWGNGVGGNGRDTRLRRLHWAKDGRPILDMTPDEEVAPAHRAVTMTVTVRR